MKLSDSSSNTRSAIAHHPMLLRLLGAVVLMVLATACGSDAEAPETVEPDEIVWGLGGKADDITCPRSAELCWNTADSRSMRQIMGAQDELLAGLSDSRRAAQKLADRIAQLDVKLTSKERAALTQLKLDADQLSTSASDAERESFISRAHSEILERLGGLYVTAYMVPVGATAQATAKGDDPGGFGNSLPQTGVNDAMRESLELLKGAGPFGKLYAFLFEHTGVLDDAYPVFDEAFPYSEPREERLKKIVDHHQWLAARNAVIAGAESLIPVAGIVISFSHRQILDFRNKMRLAIELASLYEIDIREGHNLFLVAATVMELPGTAKITAASFAIRFLAKTVVQKTANIVVNDIVRSLIAKAAAEMLKHVTTKGAEIAAKAAAQGAAASVGQQILGLATFGLIILVDAGFSAHVVDKLGNRLGVFFKPWAVGMMEESGKHLQSYDGRKCMAKILGRVATADNAVKPVEEQLLAAHLNKIWYEDDGWFGSAKAEWDALAQLSNTTDTGDVTDCAKDQFKDMAEETRLAILATARMMAGVDGSLSSKETSFLADLRDHINKSGWFSGSLDDEHVEYTYEAIDGLLVKPESIVPSTESNTVSDLTVEEVLPFMAEARPGPEAAVRCAYHGLCN